MTEYISVISQKGGVGKSTICFMLAREYILSKWSVLISDMDIKQTSCIKYNQWRNDNGIKPELFVMQATDVKRIQKVSDPYDLVIFDTPPHSTKTTLEVSKISSLCILPTQLGRLDMDEQILLAHQLVKEGIKKKRLVFVLSKVGSSTSEIAAAREYIEEAGYTVLNSEIPEKTSYRTTALDHGKTLIECQHRSLVIKAENVAQDIMDVFEKLTN